VIWIAGADFVDASYTG